MLNKYFFFSQYSPVVTLEKYDTSDNLITNAATAVNKYRYVVTISKIRATQYTSGTTFELTVRNKNATNTAAGTTPTGLSTKHQAHSPAIGGTF